MPWNVLNGSPRIEAGSLGDPTGTLPTAGNRVQGTGPFGLTRDTADRPGATGGDYWLSFLMRRSGAGGYSGLMLWSFSPSSEFVFIGEPGNPPGDGTLTIGHDDVAGFSGVPFEPNKDYFLVARFQMGPGNDAATLWVNPAPGTTPPAGGVTYTGSNLGTGTWSMQFQVVVPSGVVTRFDELRFGRSYAEVASVVPEPTAVLPAAGLLLIAAARRRRPRRLPACRI